MRIKVLVILIVILLAILFGSTVGAHAAGSCVRPFVGRFIWYNAYILTDGTAALYGNWLIGRRYLDACEPVQAVSRGGESEPYYRIVARNGNPSRLWVAQDEVRIK